MMVAAMSLRGWLSLDNATRPDRYGGRCDNIRQRLRTMRRARVVTKTASDKIATKAGGGWQD